MHSKCTLVCLYDIENRLLSDKLGLSPVHLFVIANILRRPIILFDAPHQRNSDAAVYASSLFI